MVEACVAKVQKAALGAMAAEKVSAVDGAWTTRGPVAVLTNLWPMAPTVASKAESTAM